MKTCLSVIMVGLLLLCSPTITPVIVISEHVISFDCDQIQGDMRWFSEINAGPLPNHDVVEGVDLTGRYQEIGVDAVRTHDFSGPTDISAMFPDFSLDPTVESSYNFTKTDEYISAIINADAEVFFRMGESASVDERLRQPPEDFEKWAEICKHVLMHYNDGWADGFFYNISYVEIWNEPDLSGFFNGTAMQYYRLYETTAVTLKTYDPDLRVGGPCTSSIYDQNFTIRFLEYIRDHDVPLDFYSWHRYADHPGQIDFSSRYVRGLLDAYGFEDTENINTEWNINIIYPQRDKDNARNAAFTACTLSLLQDAGMDKAFRYRGTGDDNWLTKFIGFDLALFTDDGQYKTPGLVYKIMNLFRERMPKRLSSLVMSADTNITFLGGISELRDQIGVMASNYEQESIQYTVQLDHIPWDPPGTATVFAIDDDHDFDILDQFTITVDESPLQISSLLETNSVQFIHLTNTSWIPSEGPDAYDIPWLMNLGFLDPIRALLGIALLLIFFG